MHSPITEERQARIVSWNQKKVEASYFPVSKVPMGDKFAIINQETMRKLSDVSSRYTLIKNIDIFKPFIEQFGYGAIHKFYGYVGDKFSIWN